MQTNAVSRRRFLSFLGIATVGPGARGPRGPLRGAEQGDRGSAVGGADRVFRESSEILPNPERGFYAQRSSERMDRLDTLRAQGISLLLVTLNLRDFKDRDLTAATAFGGSKLSRTGWHNDAFLVLPSDYGTYAERGWNILVEDIACE